MARVLSGVRPHLMITDPPYGVEYDPAWQNRWDISDRRRTGTVKNDRVDWRESWALFPGDVADVWHASLHAHAVVESLAAVGFELRAQLIWDKQRPIIGRAHYH